MRPALVGSFEGKIYPSDSKLFPYKASAGNEVSTRIDQHYAVDKRGWNQEGTAYPNRAIWHDVRDEIMSIQRVCTCVVEAWFPRKDGNEHTYQQERGPAYHRIAARTTVTPALPYALQCFLSTSSPSLKESS